MKFAGGVCFCVLFGILPVPLPAQQGKVIVEYPGSKELKRSARRLRISEAQLRNARQALQEATDLAMNIEPLPVPEINSLGQLWVRLHRSKAVAAIEALLGELAVSAGNAEHMRQYQNCSAAREMLLSAMADLDSEKALLLARQWPKPSADLGVEAERMSDSIVNRLRNNLLERLIYRDPERALALLADSGPADASTYQMRASLAQQLMTTGRREEGERIVQDIISDFGRRPPDPRSLENYTSFLQQLSYIDPERFPDAFGQFLRAADNLQVAGSGSGGALTLGEEKIDITYEESILLTLLRSMTSRPEMMLRTLGSFPSLKSKLDRLGGMDAFI